MREINDLTLLLLGYRLSMNSIMSHIYMGTLQMLLNDEIDLQESLLFLREIENENSKVTNLILNEKLKENSDLETLLNYSIDGYKNLTAIKKEVANRCKENKDLDRSTLMKVLKEYIEILKTLAEELAEFFNMEDIYAME